MTNNFSGPLVFLQFGLLVCLILVTWPFLLLLFWNSSFPLYCLGFGQLVYPWLTFFPQVRVEEFSILIRYYRWPIVKLVRKLKLGSDHITTFKVRCKVRPFGIKQFFNQAFGNLFKFPLLLQVKTLTASSDETMCWNSISNKYASNLLGDITRLGPHVLYS